MREALITILHTQKRLEVEHEALANKLAFLEDFHSEKVRGTDAYRDVRAKERKAFRALQDFNKEAFPIIKKARLMMSFEAWSNHRKLI